MKIKLLQWNCLYKEDVSEVTEFIKATGADIVFLQELTKGYHHSDSDTGVYVTEKLGYYSHYAYGLLRLPDNTQTSMGMGIFSRVPLYDQNKVMLQAGSVEGGKVILDERFGLEATINVGDCEYRLATTHLPFHPAFRTTNSKLLMVEQLICSAAQYPNYIFAGDLNTSPRTKAAVTLRRSGLNNLGPALHQATWTTRPFTINEWHYEALRWRLDYVLGRGNMRVASAAILETQLSDHLPIVIELEIDEDDDEALQA